MRINFVQLLSVLLSVTLIVEALPVHLPTFASIHERAVKGKNRKVGASKGKTPKVPIPKVKAPKVKVPKAKASKVKPSKVKVPTTPKAATIAPKATKAVTSPKKAATKAKVATTPKAKVAAPATTPKVATTKVPKATTGASATTGKGKEPAKSASAVPAVDLCPTKKTCGPCVATQGSDKKPCVFVVGVGVAPGVCVSAAKVATGTPATSLTKTKAECLAQDAFLKKAADQFTKGSPTSTQGQSARDHTLKGPGNPITSGRHLFSTWNRIKFPKVRDTAVLNASTGLVKLDISSAGDGTKKLKTVFNDEGVWTQAQVIAACQAAMAQIFKNGQTLASVSTQPRGIVVTNPKGVNVCIIVALESCFPSKIVAVAGNPGDAC